MVEKCEKCQKFGPDINTPSNELKFIHNPITFGQWGLDLLGPFPVAPGGVKFLIVGVDYFTKWVEAKPLATITSRKVEKFIWQHIIIRFGLPIILTTDNGKKFDCNTLREYLSDFKINIAYSLVCNPQCNGQVETANKQIVNGLKKKLDEAKGRWSEVLYDVLWSLKTTPKEATGHTPFRLVYRMEALLPLEIGVPTLRTQCYEEAENLESRLLDLELIEETQEEAALKMAAYQNRVARLCNRKVRERTFQVGDLVLRYAQVA